MGRTCCPLRTEMRLEVGFGERIRLVDLGCDISPQGLNE